MYAGPQMAGTGINQHPKRRIIPTKVMKFVHLPFVGGWPIVESGDGNGRLLELEERGILQDLIPYVG